LRCRTVSEKLQKIPFFFLTFFNSSVHQLRLFGSQQHPQRRVLSTSLSTWGTENSLAEINPERGGVITCFNIFGGKKMVNTCSFVGGRIIVQQEKNLERRTQLDERVECTSGGDPLLLHKILHLLFFPLVRILCALRLESRKKLSMVLMRDLWNFSFFGRGDVSPTHSEFCRFVSG
jgi:hypothetical protein